MKWIHTLLLLTFLFSFQAKTYGQKEIFIKQIDFKLEKVSDIDYENEYFMTIKLNKGSRYVFRIVNNLDDQKGDAIVELMDADILIMTNLREGKCFNEVAFICNKTAFYDLLIKFKDNELGSSVLDISMVQ